LNKYFDSPDAGIYEAGIIGSRYLIDKFLAKKGDINKALLGAVKGSKRDSQTGLQSNDSLIDQLLKEGATDRFGALLEALNAPNYDLMLKFWDTYDIAKIEDIINAIANSAKSNAYEKSQMTLILKKLYDVTYIDTPGSTVLGLCIITDNTEMLNYYFTKLEEEHPEMVKDTAKSATSIALALNNIEMVKYIKNNIYDSNDPSFTAQLLVLEKDMDKIYSMIDNGQIDAQSMLDTVAIITNRLDVFDQIYARYPECNLSMAVIAAFAVNNQDLIDHIAEKYSLSLDDVFLQLFGTTDLAYIMQILNIPTDI
jgi:hypothetical protein